MDTYVLETINNILFEYQFLYIFFLKKDLVTQNDL
jgi:hypothetical protein